MAEYYTEFWIVTTDGRKLYPSLIRDRQTGRLSYRTLANGSNLKSAGKSYDDPVEAIRAFLAGASLRFGAPGHTDNRFDLRGPKTARVDATPAFRAANPSLSLK